MKKNEVRTIEAHLSIRERGEGQEGESRTIRGRAIVFNSESEELTEDGMRFKEVILPEACTMEFLNTQDIKMNMLHDRQLTLARCNKGEGTLRLSVDEKGVCFEFDAPKCDIGDRCLEMVRRGDYSGCSFEFYPGDYGIEEDGNGITVRHRSFAALTGLTIGMDPAYSETNVRARELQREEPEAKPTDDSAAMRRIAAIQRDFECSF